MLPPRPLPCCPAAVGNVHYYQGLHDVASVLLMVMGERDAFPILCHLATSHLRDCTRSVDGVRRGLNLYESLWGRWLPY
jgi:hypothetical protein